jgi:hypothetical protein
MTHSPLQADSMNQQSTACLSVLGGGAANKLQACTQLLYDMLVLLGPGMLVTLLQNVIWPWGRNDPSRGHCSSYVIVFTGPTGAGKTPVNCSVTLKGGPFREEGP